MARKSLDWSATGWPRVLLGTICRQRSAAAPSRSTSTSFNFATKTPDELLNAYLVNILLPLCLAGPLLFFFTRKLRELAIANAKMSILASTDSLTAVLNRGAFTMLVEAYLNDARTQAREMQGALLIVDADHFKAINDTYGHDRGDEALKIIAERHPGRAARRRHRRPHRRRGVRRLPARRNAASDRDRRRTHPNQRQRRRVHARGSRPRRSSRSASAAQPSRSASASPNCSGSPTSGSTTPSGTAETASSLATDRTDRRSPLSSRASAGPLRSSRSWRRRSARRRPLRGCR